MKCCFLTVTDRDFFPGTVATVNSIAMFHPNVDIFVVVNHKNPLTEGQLRLLHASYRIRVVDSLEIAQEGWFVNAWELKAYGASKFLGEVDVLIGVDSDCMLCSPVSDLIEQCHASGGFIGGADGDGKHYDEPYAIYGINTPARNPKYMSTSLFFVANTATNRTLFEHWCACCNSALFNGTGGHPGHGDQGILNAILFAHGATDQIALIDNRLISQHWTFWGEGIAFHDDCFANLSVFGQRQRSFHCPSGEKFWVKEHRNRILSSSSFQIFPYIWFLGLLWFGRSRLWWTDPWDYLTDVSRHLVQDLITFLPYIMQIFPETRHLWDGISKQIVDRALDGIRQRASVNDDVMDDIIRIVIEHRSIRRFVELRSYEGRSVLTLGLRFLNRDIDFYSVESFTEHSPNEVDSAHIPSHEQYIRNMTRFMTARVRNIPGSVVGATIVFDDQSLDCLYFSACEGAPQLIHDIEKWLPKLTQGGIVAGDSYNTQAVRESIRNRFPSVQCTASGTWSVILS